MTTIVNGSFNVDKTGWTSTPSGSSTVVASRVGFWGTFTPVEGANFLQISTNGALPGVVQKVTQDVAFTAGDILAGSAGWDPLDPGVDAGTVKIYQGATLIATPWTSTDAPVLWQTWSWTCPSTGTYTIQLGAQNNIDNTQNSYALFDNITVTDAPVVTPPGQATITVTGEGWWVIEGHGFDCWLNAATSEITGIGFNCDATIEGGFSNESHVIGYGFNCNAIIEGGAELIGIGFNCNPVITINAPEYGYIKGLGFDCTPTITINVSSSMWIQGIGFDCLATIEGGAIVNGFGFNCYSVITFTVSEQLNIVGIGFNCEPVFTIVVPEFINITGHGFDAILWEGSIVGYSFDCFPSIVSVSTIVKSKAFVMNTNTNAVSRWTNYAFDNIVNLDGEYYAVNSNGFYLLDGDIDITTPVNGTILTKDSDHGVRNAKRIQYVYINGDSTVNVKPIVDSVSKNTHVSSFSGRRAQLSLGNSGRYWQFEISGIKRLQGVKIIPFIEQRRVH